jgi:alpha/beta hydrolase family protein
MSTTTGSTEQLSAVVPGYAGPCRQRWLVLHGWAQGAAFWAPAARHLAAAGIQLLCPDMAALARSVVAPAGSLERMTRLVDLLARQAGSAGVSVLIGHSSGAPPATLLAHRLPDLRGLVLLEPLPHQLGVSAPPPNAPAARASPGATRTGSPLRDRYPFAAESTLVTIAAALAPAGDHQPGPVTPVADRRRLDVVRTALSTLPVGVLVVRGEWSALLSVTGAHDVLAAAPRGRGEVMAAAGHSVHVDQPRALAELLVAAFADATRALTGSRGNDGGVP